MRVHHVALRTRDLARLERFYIDVLGFAVTTRQADRSVWLAAEDAIVMLEKAGDAEPRIPEGSMEFLAFTIETEAKSELLERFHEAGVVIEHATDFTIYVRDPDGRRVGVSDFPMPDTT